jgi:dTDP-4-amino-4,6-dideoxygalactose transaminase
MLPRKRLDVGFRDLLFGAAACFAPGSRRNASRRLERRWSNDREAVLTFSVRSGFDLLLRALELPRGSEILVSAVTIKDMVRIIEDHGLVPVPVDMDMDTLTVRPEALEAAWSPDSRAVLFAHLFGSHANLDDVAAFARRKGLLLIEDSAQSLAEPVEHGHPESDVTMFSFGPIKTSSALGGGLIGVRDLQTRARMRALQRGYPVASRRWFLLRILRYIPITAALRPAGMTLLVAISRLFGTSHDDLLNRSLRGFPGPEFFRSIRRRPPYPMMALLHRRLTQFRREGIRVRAGCGEAAASMLTGIRRPGRSAEKHTHWIFPVWPQDPDGLMRHLWSLGFDATRGASSLAAVGPASSRPEITAPEATEAMGRTLFLPVYPEVPDLRLAALARAVTEYEAGAAREPVSRADPVVTNRGLVVRAGGLRG